METLFIAVNATALLGWGLLLLIPKHGLTKALVHNLFLPGILCVIYAAFLVNEVGFGAASGEGSFSSIDAVQGLFAAPNGVFAFSGV